MPIKSTTGWHGKTGKAQTDARSRLGPTGRPRVPTAPRRGATLGPPDALLQPASLARKGYRTDATVSVFLGFLLFLIPAKKPCFGKKKDGERGARGDAGAGSSHVMPKSEVSEGA